MKFKEYLNESIFDLKIKLNILILNSFLYKQSLNESFEVSDNLYVGRSKLKSKYKIVYDK